MQPSPQPIGKKVIETSFNKVVNEIDSLITLRKGTGQIIEQLYSMETAHMLKKLKGVEVQLSETQPYKQQNMDKVFEMFETLSKDSDKDIKKISEHMKLLNILNQKRSCPISQIIDDI